MNCANIMNSKPSELRKENNLVCPMLSAVALGGRNQNTATISRSFSERIRENLYLSEIFYLNTYHVIF